MKCKATQPALAPVYVRPEFDRHERIAMRAWERAAYTGKRHTPMRGTFDPLFMRMGMRMNCVAQRAGWVVSNPLYHQSLRRRPDTDPSLPGPGWLRELYQGSQHDDLVLLDSSRAAKQARCAARHDHAQPIATTTSITARAAVVQADLFA